ncbi:hypothetical protein PVAP13_1NG396200 [Panicum virgatum]|nr:hypothetical protein PVAP13_1NG396200 [Panicum virgatum]
MLLLLFLLSPLSCRQAVVDGKSGGAEVQGAHGLILGRSTRRALSVKVPEGPGCCHPIPINSGPHGRPGN